MSCNGPRKSNLIEAVDRSQYWFCELRIDRWKKTAIGFFLTWNWLGVNLCFNQHKNNAIQILSASETESVCL